MSLMGSFVSGKNTEIEATFVAVSVGLDEANSIILIVTMRNVPNAMKSCDIDLRHLSQGQDLPIASIKHHIL